MPKITFIENNGTQYEIDGSVGDSLMMVAVNSGVEAIIAECGGACACATCHCFIEPEWMKRVGGPNEMESPMLDMTASPRQKNSRLSCQINLSVEHDGMVVRLPEEQ